MSDQISLPEEKQMSDENKDDPKDMMEQDEEDVDESSGDEEEEENEEGSLQKAKQALTCRKVTLNTLMDEGIIEPGEGALSIDYLGQRFEADLLPSGKIKWKGSEEEFGTPSAWALHCKRLVNPIKRSGCGWASVKYRGKKLDAWKSVWARKHRTSPFKSPHQVSSSSASPSATTSSPPSATTTITPPSSLTSNNTTLTTSTSPPTTSHPDTNVSTVAINSESIAPTETTTTTTATTTTTDNDKCPPLQSSSLSSATSLSSAMPSSTSLSALLSIPPADSKSSILSATLMATGSSLSPSKNSELLKENMSDVQIKETMLSPMKDLVSNCHSSNQQKSPIKATQDASLTVVTQLPSIHTTHTAPPFLLPTGSKRRSPSNQSPHKEPFIQTRTNNTDVVLKDRKCVRYSELDMRTPDIDMNTLVHCEKFDNHKKLQPFSVLVSTNAMLLMDFHCHLTKSEVVGYLGGHWDANKQILSIEQSFPVLCRFADKLQAPVVEEEIRRRMKSRKLMVVGWYHSHPYCLPQPSLRDVDCQMAYQLQMRGVGSTYHPCIGFIEAPFEKQENFLQGFWVMPNLEHPASFNIPMHISYTVRRDLSLTEDILIDMKLLSEFYSGSPDRVRFKERWKDDLSYLDKMRTSMAAKLPEDQLDSGTFLDYMQQLLRDMK